MKYYYKEHIQGYQRVKEEGKIAWNEIHGNKEGFENFASRAFLEEILPQLHFTRPNPATMECGCGTGPGACFLAERGFQVDGIDLSSVAIEIAREQARIRGLDIHYEVKDICELPLHGKKYDMIVDSYCLQCIVTTEDRERVFALVHSRLKPDGYYLISTAMFYEKRLSEDRLARDTETGIVYNGYDEDDLIDMKTGIVLQKQEKPDDLENAVNVNGIWYRPVRRHWKAAGLSAELKAAGFNVVYQGGELGGNVVYAIH